MGDEKKPKKIVSIRLTEALEIAGTNRNYVALAAEWAKLSGLEMTHAGGMGALVRWSQRTNSPDATIMRHEALVQCHQINFEPVAQ